MTGSSIRRADRACASSHSATPRIPAITIRKVALTVSSVSRTSPPRARPTAMAAGRLRPARIFRSLTCLPCAGRPAACRAARRARPRGQKPGMLPFARLRYTRPASYLEQLRLLVPEQLVDLRDVRVGQLVELALGPPALVLAGFAVPHQLVDRVLGVAADVPDRHPPVLRLVPGDLDVLPAPLLGELGEDHADHRAVIGRVDAEVAVADRPLDRGERALVEGLDQHHPRLRHVERGELVHRRLRPVVLSRDLAEHRRVSTTRPDAREVLLGDRDGLLHLLLGFEEDLVDHCGSSAPLAPCPSPSCPVPRSPRQTSVPIGSPRTARTTFPACIRSKTTIGRSLSMHRLTAVASMNLSPRRSTSL